MADFYVSDRRKFTRVPMNREARCWAANQMLVCELVDLSMEGALIQHEGNWDPQLLEEVELLICLDQQHLDCLQMEGDVAYVAGNRVGLHCKHPTLENINLLKKIMKEKISSEELLNSEFRQALSH